MSDPENNILRRPSVNGDVKTVYIAFDKNSKIILFLDPQAIPWSYNEDIHQRMKTDTHEFYSKTKWPNPKSSNNVMDQQLSLLPLQNPWNLNLKTNRSIVWSPRKFRSQRNLYRLL